MDFKLADCIKIAEGTLQNLKQKLGGGICGGYDETNPRLVRLGLSISRIPQSPSPKPAHIRTPEPAESPFDQDFDQFMNSLDNSEPFDDLEDWSDNVDLFMDAVANPPEHDDALWELAKLKKGKAKAPEQFSKSIFDKSWIMEPEGLSHSIMAILDERERPPRRDGHSASRSPKAHIFKNRRFRLRVLF